MHLAKTHWPSVDGRYTGYRPDPTVTLPERSPKRQRAGTKAEDDSQVAKKMVYYSATLRHCAMCCMAHGLPL